MNGVRIVVLLIVGALALLQFHATAEAGDTLTRIKAKGTLRCGVRDGVPGEKQ